MRIITLLARHGTATYGDAVEAIDGLLERQMPEVAHDLLVIDNALPEHHHESLGPGHTLIGAPNTHWEFSAWDRGVSCLGARLDQYDFIHLATSAFRTLYTRYLDRFDVAMLELIRGRAAAVGHIDYYNEPVTIGAFSGKVNTDLGFTRDRHSIQPKSAQADLGGFPKENATSAKSRVLFSDDRRELTVNPNEKHLSERSVRSWLRSSFVFLAPIELRLLGSLVSLDDPRSFFSGDSECPFRDDAPLSTNYRQYIIGWLTGRGTGQGVEWHSRFELTQATLSLFEAKAMAILNEQMLSSRLRAQGCALVDATWLAARHAQLPPDHLLGAIPSWRWQVAQRDVDAAPQHLIEPQ
jgi:hypothetical protein